jgi:hypothetical protein
MLGRLLARILFAATILLVPACGGNSQAPVSPVSAPEGNFLIAPGGHARIVSDGAGGAILFWTGVDGLGSRNIQFQRFSSNGAPIPPRGSISTLPMYPLTFEVISDGAGGAIIAWDSITFGASGQDIYVQRINATGTVQWTPGGVPVCTSPWTQGNCRLIGDGSGGAIIAWEDVRSLSSGLPKYELFAQRIDSSGTPAWTLNGVRLVSIDNNDFRHGWDLAADGFNGAILAWVDVFRVVTQRVSDAGVPLWGASGKPVTTVISGQYSPKLLPAGSGHSFVAWTDKRDPGGDAVYLQKLDDTGAPQWNSGGIAASPLKGWVPHLVTDDGGGVLVFWNENSGGGNDYNLMGQRLDSAGTAQWASGGVPICTTPETQLIEQVIPDGSGGACVVWRDFSSLTDYDLYANRVNGSGALQWSLAGVAVCVASYDQNQPHSLLLSSGRLILAWADLRNGPQISEVYYQILDAAGSASPPVPDPKPTPPWQAANHPVAVWPPLITTTTTTPDGSGGAFVVWVASLNPGLFSVYAQRIDSEGNPLWGLIGKPICASTAGQGYPAVISDGSSGAIIVWADHRNGSADIYGQRIDNTGAALWTANGIPLVADPGSDDGIPILVSDGAGGAILVWSSSVPFSSAPPTVSSQRFDLSGAPLWSPGGVLLTNSGWNSTAVRALPDGTGGVYAAWEDSRNGDVDVFAQRLNSSGVPQWGAGGASIVTAPGRQFLKSLIQDGNNVLYVGWNDEIPPFEYPTYVQKVSSAGAKLWPTAGVPLRTPGGQQNGVWLAPDASGGVYGVWRDARTGTFRCFLQHLDNNGARLWGPDGIAISGTSGYQDIDAVASDGADGLIVCWEESTPYFNLWVQRFSPTNATLWAQDGLSVSGGSGGERSASLIPDGSGGALLVWDDSRRGLSGYLYAQRIQGNGSP